jgi:hypothetical protein
MALLLSVDFEIGRRAVLQFGRFAAAGTKRTLCSVR